MDAILKVLEIELVLVSSAVSWGLVEAMKPILKPRLSRPVRASLFRVCSILFGAASGYFFSDGLESAGVGAACGAFSTFTVAILKRLISKKANVDLEEIEGEEAEVGSSADS